MLYFVDTVQQGTVPYLVVCHSDVPVVYLQQYQLHINSGTSHPHTRRYLVSPNLWGHPGLELLELHLRL